MRLPRLARSATLPRVNGTWRLCAVIGLAGCHRSTPRMTHDAAVATTHDVVTTHVTASVDASAPRFDPHWSCRIVGSGRVGHMPHVSTPPPRPGAPPGSIEDVLVLADGRALRRELVRDDAGAARLDRARVSLYAPNDAGLSASRDFDVRANEQEFLFSDDHGAGVGFWNGDRIAALRIGSTSEEILVAASRDLTRACVGMPRTTLRLWPVFAHALAFPYVVGIPPATADARYTLALDAQGVCVVRLEGEGPWGRVFADATPDGGLRGDLSISESINPVVCGAAVH